ncbi:UDP-N-acetyl-D-galactosamine dehydrogenase [Paenibacillus sp. CCS19]|uniref:nucleotide sugar dehydrogenase n=1 Tax=Paenibacillus sp. CCS19 TaxID=3158387 RepID=UPI0025640A99|nr:nucleotide sugar dehydrogenase [Paenibacillus cellulosilyticus]GMK37420.1 UDP-N-acetyl-D-galactosamine dehydrogenase [Paenibacillus cellulosilyticus]
MTLSSLYESIIERSEPLAVVGLGYVGLPLAVAFAKQVDVIGFDLNERKIQSYRNGEDLTGELENDDIRSSGVCFTSDEAALEEARFFIVAVPTPIQSGNIPDLKYVTSASQLIGRKLRKGAVVVFESTVYPGVTEEVCVPILEAESGLRCGQDFKVGYSPERINPGDKVHRLENTIKIVSGMDEETLDYVAHMYELIIEAGVYRADSIRVAEAAKVIENAQRDVNIAFMNELSMLFHEMGIETKAVLEAASTKWNFLRFNPGLVGGHCIGIDPYYLTYKAEDSGYRSRIILAGRHINDGMGKYVAQSLVKTLVRRGLDLNKARIGVFGLTYKENTSDIRNTKVTDVIRELNDYGIVPLVADPVANAELAYEEYGIELTDMADMKELDVILLAVPHEEFISMSIEDYDALYSAKGPKIMYDIKGVYPRKAFESRDYYYWSL